MHNAVRGSFSAELGDLFLEHPDDAVAQLDKRGRPAGEEEITPFARA